VTYFYPWSQDRPPPWMTSLAGHDEDDDAAEDAAP